MPPKINFLISLSLQDLPSKLVAPMVRFEARQGKLLSSPLYLKHMFLTKNVLYIKPWGRVMRGVEAGADGCLCE